MSEKFTAKLKVNKQIVSLLSESTYQRSFPSAIREIVSNAYDADALSVKINFDKNLTYIEIEDNGNGMTKSEFYRYLTIAGIKQESEFTRKYKRKRIGQFGVGFLSIFPFCETIEIITTTENSTEVLKARIPAKDYFKQKPMSDEVKSKSKKEDDGNIYIDDIPIFGEINTIPKEKLRHYTIIKLVTPSHIVKQYFKAPKTKRGISIQAYKPMKRLIWELEEDLPISLSQNSKYAEEYKYDEPIGIEVFVNEELLVRHDYLDNVLASGSQSFDNIKCKYVFTTNFKSIKPEEARGIKLRVNNVGIGPRSDFSLRRSRGFPRLHFVTGEIFFSEEMKVHLNLGRDGFISNQITDEIFEFFADKLRDVANEVQTISEAEKDISNSKSTRKSNATKSQAEVLSLTVKRLLNRGYKLIEVTKAKEKVVIDKINKIVYVDKSAYDQNEIISVLGKNVLVTYERWDLNEPYPACKFIGRNNIQINQNYPLFKSKSVGNIFKRIFLMLLIGSKKANTSKQLFELFNSSLLKEFKDFLK